MSRKHDLGEFDVRYDLESLYGVVYSVFKRGDTYDEDGGRNRHGWHWEVRCAGTMLASDGASWTDDFGLKHDGYPSAELAYEGMAMRAVTPKEYREAYDKMARNAERRRELREQGLPFLGRLPEED